MFAHSTFAAIVLLGLASISGCGPAKLDETKSLQVAAGEGQILNLDAQPKPQTIRVQFESTQSPVTVLLVKASDAPKQDDALYVSTEKALAFKKGEKSGELSAEVPPNTATAVIVRDATANTTVKVHIKN